MSVIPENIKTLYDNIKKVYDNKGMRTYPNDIDKLHTEIIKLCNVKKSIEEENSELKEIIYELLLLGKFKDEDEETQYYIDGLLKKCEMILRKDLLKEKISQSSESDLFEAKKIIRQLYDCLMQPDNPETRCYVIKYMENAVNFLKEK